MKKITTRQLAALLMLLPFSVLAQPAPDTLLECARIIDDEHRLACFDRIAAASVGPAVAEDPSQASPTDSLGSGITAPGDSNAAATINEAVDETIAADVNAKINASAEPPSLLAKHWETETRYERGTFRMRPHQENYIVFAKYDASPNEEPFAPFESLTPDDDGLNQTELAFQLGFKTKLLENVMSGPADLWFGYTQKSFWQAYSKSASSPFRETNYQPEVMLVMPLDFKLLGLRARFLNIGFVHESNGQTSTLSRSWNRIYAQVGWERGDFSLLARTWTRVDEGDSPDDNPDIIDYMGHGDILATWRRNGHQLSLLGRHNFSTGHSALQVGWAFPMVGHLKGYVQAFSGYGQSLIDYNSRQNTVGVGVLLDY